MVTKGLVGLTLLLLAIAGCSSGSGRVGADTRPRVVTVVAGENFWGSIAAQVGGSHAVVVSLVTNPNADPHAYEASAVDAERVAEADLVIVNGIGYDPWLTRLVAADGQHQTVIDVGHLLGQPIDGNPHVWYSQTYVARVISAIGADLAALDPSDADYFAGQSSRFEQVDLAPLHQLERQVSSRFAGTPVGASESIFAMMAPDLGLDLITPPALLRAISEGTDVSATDRATVDHQIAAHQIRIYVYNSQNATPDIQSQLAECRAAGIPTATITETLAPASTTYQQWQTDEVSGILAALDRTR